MPVEDGGAGGAGKQGAAQLDGLVGKEQAGRVEQLPIGQQTEFGEGVGRVVPRQSGPFHKAAYFVFAQFGQCRIAGLVVPAQGGAVALEDQAFQFAGAHLPVFVGHADVGAAVREIRLLVTCGLHTQAGFARHVDRGDFGVKPRLDVRSQCLRYVAQGFLVGHEARWFAAGGDAKPQIGLPVFVEHGHERDQALLEFGQAGFEFDGFGFAGGQGVWPAICTGTWLHGLQR